MLKLTILLILGSVAVQAQRIERIFQDGNYVLGYEVNAAGTFITVDALVKTTGYVAFGVSNRDGPGMANSDIIIAGFDELDGNNYFGDFHANADGPPVLDTRQDGTLLRVSQNDGATFVEFTRQLVTGDPNPGQDVDISGSTFLMWAYGGSDIVEYHFSNRGKVSQSQLRIPSLPPFKLPTVAKA